MSAISDELARIKWRKSMLDQGYQEILIVLSRKFKHRERDIDPANAAKLTPDDFARFGLSTRPPPC